MPSTFRHTAQLARLKVNGQTLLTLQDGDHPDEWNESYYTFTDHLGTGTITMDTTGTILSIDLYTPFGDTSYTSRPRARHRYCGKEKDKESGLYYYGARYYECWTCRFVSVDPLAEKFAQLSSYNYADNSPVTDLDLDGLQGTDTTESASSQGSSKNSDSNDYIFDATGKLIKKGTPYGIIKIRDVHNIDINISEFSWNYSNAKGLANISNYILLDSKNAKGSSNLLSLDNLNGSSVSVVNRSTDNNDTSINKNIIMRGLYNYSRKEEIVAISDNYAFTINPQRGKSTIAISLTEGHLSKLMNHYSNFQSVLVHEVYHIIHKDIITEGNNHLKVYHDQVKHSSWKYVTDDFKESLREVVSGLVNTALNYTATKGWSADEIEMLHKAAKAYERIFTKAGILK